MKDADDVKELVQRWSEAYIDWTGHHTLEDLQNPQGDFEEWAECVSTLHHFHPQTDWSTKRSEDYSARGISPMRDLLVDLLAVIQVSFVEQVDRDSKDGVAYKTFNEDFSDWMDSIQKILRFELDNVNASLAHSTP